jgi:hypothetical protein
MGSDNPEAPEWSDDLWMFQKKCRQRMLAGEKEYGNKSFSKHPETLLTEIQEELEDVSMWAFILWERIEQIREAISSNE